MKELLQTKEFHFDETTNRWINNKIELEIEENVNPIIDDEKIYNRASFFMNKHLVHSEYFLHLKDFEKVLQHFLQFNSKQS